MVTLQWEEVAQPGYAGNIQRAMIPGGWLVREVQDQIAIPPGVTDSPSVRDYGYQWQTSLCFVPDPEHTWKE
jgi:hypothetical protein